MRFHVVGLPHTKPNGEYPACAYTNKVMGFARMMGDRGHKVFLYGAGNECRLPAATAEFVPALPELLRAKLEATAPHYTEVKWDSENSLIKSYNHRVAAEISQRYEPGDFVALIGGVSQRQIANSFPRSKVVEFGVGYTGSFSDFKVFESYAWMHTCYGAAAGKADRDGYDYDVVVPGYLDPAEYPLGDGKPGGLFYLGRLIDRKGLGVAVDVAKRLGINLWTAGPGTPPDPKYHLGVLNNPEKAKVLGSHTAVIAPTRYIEPFGNVAIEAMATGTPVLTSDWGAFTETVIHGKTGFRCHTVGEFCEAFELVKARMLDRLSIREHVVDNYSLDATGKKYETYFKRLQTLDEKGFYSEAPTLYLPD